MGKWVREEGKTRKMCALRMWHIRKPRGVEGSGLGPSLASCLTLTNLISIQGFIRLDMSEFQERHEVR